MNSGNVVWPLDTHLAALTVAYSIIKCASLFAALCWHGSILTEGQISAEPKYAAIDWQCWVRYGSWSQCPHCGSLMYNDQYFQDYIYQTQATTGKPHVGASRGFTQRASRACSRPCRRELALVCFPSRLESMEELESRFGDSIRHQGQEHPTGYLLCQALRRLEAPVLVSSSSYS